MAFIFFNPYETQDIDQATKFENALVEKYKVYRQDVSHQTILFNQLKLTQTVAAALYENGQLIKVVNSIDELEK
ncbi:hypothetical protein ACWYVZ_02620 [Pediococcus acidilactici]